MIQVIPPVNLFWSSNKNVMKISHPTFFSLSLFHDPPLTYSVNSDMWNSYPNKLKRFSALFEYSYLWTGDFVINVGLAYDFTNQGEDIKPDEAHHDNDNRQVRGIYFGFCWKIMS